MSAIGELYVNENCRDVFKKELDEKFGKDMWKLDGTPYNDLWIESEFPDTMEVDVLNLEYEKIGRVLIINEFSIQDYGMGKFIDVEPKSIKIL